MKVIGSSIVNIPESCHVGVNRKLPEAGVLVTGNRQINITVNNNVTGSFTVWFGLKQQANATEVVVVCRERTKCVYLIPFSEKLIGSCVLICHTHPEHCRQP